MTEYTPNADLQSLLVALAASEIVVPGPRRTARDFADWCELQRPADIDTVILGWLRSQVPQSQAPRAAALS